MPRLTDTEVPVQMALVLSIALVAAPVVRTVTVGLDATLGRAWPFSLARCHAEATPGCLDRWPPSATGRPTQHIRVQHIRTARL